MVLDVVGIRKSSCVNTIRNIIIQIHSLLRKPSLISAPKYSSGKCIESEQTEPTSLNVQWLDILI